MRTVCYAHAMCTYLQCAHAHALGYFLGYFPRYYPAMIYLQCAHAHASHLSGHTVQPHLRVISG